MPTFDGHVQTRTRVSLTRDSFSPGMGALGAGSAREHALIHGNRIEVIDTTLNLTVTGASTITLVGAVVLNAQNTVTSTVIGLACHTNQGPVVQTHAAPVLHNRMAAWLESTFGPTLQNHIAPWLRSNLAVELKTDYSPGIEVVLGPKLRIETVKVSIGVQKTDVYANTLSCAGAKYDFNLVKGGTDNIWAKLRAVKAEAGGVDAKAKGAQPVVAGARANVGAVQAKVESRVKTLPGIGPPMPLVATT